MQSNTGTIQAQSAFFQANTGTTQAQASFVQANTGTTQAQASFVQANTGTIQAQSAFFQANTGTTQAQASFLQSNTGTIQAQASFLQSNNAYTTANTKFNTSGGNITGPVTISSSLTVTGNVTFSGNVTTVNANNLIVEDNMFYLNNGSIVTNPDLGFAGNYNDGTYHHAGFFRDHSDGVWKIFDNYRPEPDASPYIDTSNNTFRIANFQANNVTANSFSGTANNSNYLNGYNNTYYTNASNLSTGTLPNTRLSVVPNSALQNSSVTIGSTSVSLGSTVSSFAGVTLTSPTFTTPSLGTPASGNFSTGTFTWPTFNQNTSGSAGSVVNALTINNGGAGAASGTTYNGSAAVTLSYNSIGASPLAGSSSLTTTGTVTSGTWSGSFGAVSGANLTGLTAGNLSGTIPSGVLGNSTHYVGTTAIALNRASASQTLTGVSIDGNAANITAYTINQNVGSSNSPTFAGITTSGNITRNAAGVGWLSGNYGTAETGSTTHAIYSIGGSYYPTSSSLNNMYGIGYCASTTFSGFSIANWGLYVASSGTSRHFFDSDTGNSYSSASKRAPIFYDYNDTGYYIDPNSTGVTALRVRGGAVFGPNNTWSAYLQIGGNSREYVDNASFASVATSDGNLHMDAASAHSMYLNFYDGSNIYFGNGANSYNAYVNSSGYGYFPLIYDNNDTGYYCDPNSTSRFYLTTNNIYKMYGEGGDSGVANQGYAIYQQSGGWSHPYPDLAIGFHTGIKIGAYFGYNGTRFYNNSDFATLIASIGDGDNAFRSYDNVIAYASDKRLKENIIKIPNAIDKVMSINGVTFDWKDMVYDLGFEPSNKHEVGVLAQEVEKVLPEAVEIAPFDYDWKVEGKSKSGEKYLTVKYEKLVPLLIEAIKEQQNKIEHLEKIIYEKL